MLRTTLLSTAAIFVIVAPAFADGKGGHQMTGLGDLGYDYGQYDDFDVDRLCRAVAPPIGGDKA